jgi:ABC-2 type transport system permease protein
MRALWKLTWLELKIFAREPLGLIGALIVPAVMVVVLGGALRGGGLRGVEPDAARLGAFVGVNLPVLGAMVAALNAVLALVTIVSIYREGGILKRLRATPVSAVTILSAHVIVRIVMTMATLAVMVMAGRRIVGMHLDARTLSFAVAAVISMVSILSIGFLIASVVPTARFAQPVGAVILYPMLAISGLFVPLTAYPGWLAVLARALPLTYSVSLLRGIWIGESWPAHIGDVAALAVFAVVFTAASARWFRWQ